MNPDLSGKCKGARVRKTGQLFARRSEPFGKAEIFSEEGCDAMRKERERRRRLRWDFLSRKSEID